jgi:hypothetical protein
MFSLPAFSLLSAIRRDAFAVSSATLPDLCWSRIPLLASGLSFEQKVGEQKSAKPYESAKPHKMSTFKNGAATLVK